MTESNILQKLWERDNEFNKWEIRGYSKAKDSPPDREPRPCVLCSVNPNLVDSEEIAKLIEHTPLLLKVLKELSHANEMLYRASVMAAGGRLRMDYWKSVDNALQRAYWIISHVERKPPSKEERISSIGYDNFAKEEAKHERQD